MSTLARITRTVLSKYTISITQESGYVLRVWHCISGLIVSYKHIYKKVISREASGPCVLWARPCWHSFSIQQWWSLGKNVVMLYFTLLLALITKCLQFPPYSLFSRFKSSKKYVETIYNLVFSDFSFPGLLHLPLGIPQPLPQCALKSILVLKLCLLRTQWVWLFFLSYSPVIHRPRNRTMSYLWNSFLKCKNYNFSVNFKFRLFQI